MKKTNIAILGATGMVGQRFVTLLENHPYFDVKVLAASPNSKGKKYIDAVAGKWKLDSDIPSYVKEMVVEDVSDVDEISKHVELVLCALDLDNESIIKIEEAYAKNEIIVVSNNSANRWTQDVPVLIPEINIEQLEILEFQKKRLGTKKGFIVAKPNCSIQSYVPALDALKEFGLKEVIVSTYQAISGSGKTFVQWPEMVGNVIPYIGGEEEKSEKEPLKIWAKVEAGKIVNATEPVISAQCIRVAVLDGHMATVAVKFHRKPTKEEILDRWNNYNSKIADLDLPLAPKKFLNYMEDESRPQPRLDRDLEKGMAITIGRLREDSIFDYKFVCLSHNTLRGAAGGALLTAELIKKSGYLD
ncbi:MAG: aspartate-semialdehyde dehydrogenase [Proteocatella sp.]